MSKPHNQNEKKVGLIVCALNSLVIVTYPVRSFSIDGKFHHRPKSSMIDMKTERVEKLLSFFLKTCLKILIILPSFRITDVYFRGDPM